MSVTVELYESAEHRTPIMEIRVPDAKGRGVGLAKDGLPDVIVYRSVTFIRIFDGANTPRYVKGDAYDVSA